MNLNKFERLRKRIKEVQREADKAAGALAEVKKRLAEYGCKTVVEAKKLLKKKRAESVKLHDEFDSELEAFEKEFGDVLK